MKKEMKKKKEVQANELARFIRKHGFTYDGYSEINRMARQIVGLKPPKRKKSLHVLPTKGDLTKLLNELAKNGSIKHDLMIRLMWFTGLRNFELCNIKMQDVHFEDDGKEKILIHGKGGYERFVAVPPGLSRDIRRYLKEIPQNKYLFESRIGKPYSTAGVRKMVRKYRDDAGLSNKIYPHNFRHVVGTDAIELGISKEKIQNILRHVSMTSTDIYTNSNEEWTRSEVARLERSFNSQ